MALRNVRIIGDELLTKQSREITDINDRILQLLDDMAETMYHEDGVGLAAPQVGVLRKAVVIDVGEGLVKLINPEVVESSGDICEIEGCLSVPEEVGYVHRPEWVKVKAKNEKGEDIEIEATGLYRKALCHEIDHLKGILFTDVAESVLSKEEYEELLREEEHKRGDSNNKDTQKTQK